MSLLRPGVIKHHKIQTHTQIFKTWQIGFEKLDRKLLVLVFKN